MKYYWPKSLTPPRTALASYIKSVSIQQSRSNSNDLELRAELIADILLASFGEGIFAPAKSNSNQIATKALNKNPASVTPKAPEKVEAKDSAGRKYCYDKNKGAYARMTCDESAGGGKGDAEGGGTTAKNPTQTPKAPVIQAIRSNNVPKPLVSRLLKPKDNSKPKKSGASINGAKRRIEILKKKGQTGLSAEGFEYYRMARLVDYLGEMSIGALKQLHSEMGGGNHSVHSKLDAINKIKQKLGGVSEPKPKPKPKPKVVPPVQVQPSLQPVPQVVPPPPKPVVPPTKQPPPPQPKPENKPQIPKPKPKPVPLPKPKPPKPTTTPKIGEEADEKELLEKFKENLVEKEFNGQKIKTVLPTKDTPLTAKEHGLLAKAHFRVADIFGSQGNLELYKAHSTAGKYHYGETFNVPKPVSPPNKPDPSKQRLETEPTVTPQPKPKLPQPESRPRQLSPSGVKELEIVNKSLDDDFIHQHLGIPVVSPENKTLYKQSMSNVFARIPEAAMSRVNSSKRMLGEGYLFFQSAEDLSAFSNKIHKTNKDIVGCWSFDPTGKNGNVFLLDGAGNPEHTGKYKFASGDIEGVYAHEFSHAIDGEKSEYSNNVEWIKAWQKEINEHDSSGEYRLTSYAGLEGPHEGWAEFGRLLYSKDGDIKNIEQDFPRCFAYWKKQGFVPL